MIDYDKVMKNLTCSIKELDRCEKEMGSLLRNEELKPHEPIMEELLETDEVLKEVKNLVIKEWEGNTLDRFLERVRTIETKVQDVREMLYNDYIIEMLPSMEDLGELLEDLSVRIRRLEVLIKSTVETGKE